MDKPLAKAFKVPVGNGKFALVDPEDGFRVASVTWRACRSGKTTYARTCSYRIGKAQRLMHRMVMGASHGEIIDHINGNGLDNRRCNLRFATAQENNRNQFLQDREDGKTSRFKGVHFDGTYWLAQITPDRDEQKHLGRFDNEIDAAKAYDNAAVEFFGEIARTNGMLGLYPGQLEVDRNEPMATGPAFVPPEKKGPVCSLSGKTREHWRTD